MIGPDNGVLLRTAAMLRSVAAYAESSMYTCVCAVRIDERFESEGWSLV
jgi:hypothetical protein